MFIVAILLVLLGVVCCIASSTVSPQTSFEPDGSLSLLLVSIDFFVLRVSTSSLPCRRFSLCLSFSWSWKFEPDINGKVEEEEAEEEKKKSGDIKEKAT